MKKSALILCILLLVLGFPASVSAGPATLPPLASDIVVNTLSDFSFGGCNATQCTLREAIQKANTDALQPAQIRFTVSGTITLASALPAVTNANGVTITGPITISGDNSVRIMSTRGDTVTGARALLTVKKINFIDGRASTDTGGAINNNFGVVYVYDCTFDDNQALQGGAIYNDGGNGSVRAEAYIYQSTFLNNSATGTTGTHNGGAIFNGSATTKVYNSTFIGNSGDIGAAIFNSSGWEVYISSSTFWGNVIEDSGATIYNAAGGMRVGSTILANSIDGANCGWDFPAIQNMGDNLDSGTSCNFGSALGSKSSTDPHLASLGNYGGPTQTMALQDGSPAIDGVSYNDSNVEYCPAIDQRGFPRAFDGDHNGVARCDIGAFESEPLVYLPLVIR